MLNVLTVFLQQSDDGSGGGASGIIGLIVGLLVIAGLWKVFTKAGKPGWAAIIPIYNVVVLLQIAGKPVWWIILFLILFVNFVIMVLVWMGVAKAFGKGVGYTIGLLVLSPIFIPMLGFGSAKYSGVPA
ncbi:MAG: DUF5684 domain-containing protein [Chloroflexales bacterium]